LYNNFMAKISVKRPVLKVNKITKYYGSFLAVEDIDFSISKGEVVGLVGLNGSGKSTIINMLLGFLRCSKGSVELLKQLITPETAHKAHQKVGFATGDMSLFSNLTGKQYLAFLKRAYHIPKADKKTDELCTQFEPQLDKKMRDLSRGNRQKIALIAAFMHSPEMVILDEPSSGLDPMMQQVFLDLIGKEGAKGTTIFMSSHYLNEVADVCSRVLFIKDGKLVKDISRAQMELINGKAVRVVTKTVIRPPKGAEITSHHRISGGYELEFLYKVSPVKLQQWLAGLTSLIDFNVAEHDLESAFSDLFVTDKKEKK
jgi:ABC-2 type transport system ATP-binding protein